MKTIPVVTNAHGPHLTNNNASRPKAVKGSDQLTVGTRADTVLHLRAVEGNDGDGAILGVLDFLVSRNSTPLSQEVRRRLLLLDDPEMTVERIAEQLRYTDASAFRRAFRDWTGLQPSRYRAQKGHNSHILVG